MATQIAVVQEAINFFALPTSNYVRRWRRDHTGRLLAEYIQDIRYKERMLQQLSENSAAQEEWKDLRNHLELEKERVQESATMMEAELKKAQEELKSEREKNERYQRILKQMLAFVQKNRDAFFAFVHRQGIVIDIQTFDEIMDSMTLPLLVEICENMQLISFRD